MSARTLRQDLGLKEATSLVVGSMIGVGIFLGTQSIANLVVTPALILAVWLAGGLIVFLGALTYAELGSALPESGGQYAFMREAYGPGVAFATGWSGFLIAKGASVAALAVGFSQYVASLVVLAPAFAHWQPVFDRALAVVLISVLVLVNVRGVKHAGRVQFVTTALKVGALAVLAVGGLLVFGKDVGVLADAAIVPDASGGSASGGLVAAFGLALIPAFFAYDGWVNSTQVAEEVRDARRIVPRSVVLGVLFVAGVYTLVNLVYLLALGPEGVAASSFAAADTARALAGEPGRLLIVAAILVSITGTMNAVIMSGPRIAFAMARDGIFFKRTVQVSEKHGTPAASIMLLGALSIGLVLLPTIGSQPLFETLLTYVIFTSFVFYALGAGAVFILRRTRPDLPREYKTWGYPVVPALFIIASTAFLVNTAMRLPYDSLMGVLLVASGFPFYWYWRREKRRAPVTRAHPNTVQRVTFTLRDADDDSA